MLGPAASVARVARASLALACTLGGCGERSAPVARPAPVLRAPSPRAVFGPELPATIAMELATDQGRVRCTVEPRRAPRAAAILVGLARGGHAWRDPRSGAVTTRPLYRALRFVRTIAGAYAQVGCPRGDATGQPGYRVPLELNDDDRARLAEPGVLFAAVYHPAPSRPDPAPPPPGDVVGSQIAIGLADMSHLAGQTTVLGRCTDLDTVSRIAARPRGSPARLDALVVVAPP